MSDGFLSNDVLLYGIIVLIGFFVGVIVGGEKNESNVNSMIIECLLDNNDGVPIDAFGTRIKIIESDDSITYISAGEDEEFNTDDDLVRVVQ